MVLGVRFSDIVPYTSVHLDCSFSDIVCGLEECSKTTGEPEKHRAELLQNLHHFFVTETNPSPALVCLSVRTAFDLYLRVARFPPDAEIIFSAINIPDMAYIARQHGLKVVPCDLDLATLGPQIHLLEKLITCETVAIVVAHLFGRWCDVEPIIQIAGRHNLQVIEDCAEAFCGLSNLGHPKSDLVLFSFGPIKFYTAFGGAVAKIRDRALWTRMSTLYSTYPIQATEIYFWKLVKCALVFLLLDVPYFIKPGMYITDRFGIDHKKHVVSMLRGFPENLLFRLRHQPPTALLTLLLKRLEDFTEGCFKQSAANGQYVWERLPPEILKFGQKVLANNFWLFPVLVDNPKRVALELNKKGIDAYVGVSQLNVVHPETDKLSMSSLDNDQSQSRREVYLSSEPKVARFFINHVMYLPVNKSVPKESLERICQALAKVTHKRCKVPVPPPDGSDNFFLARL
ncbi:uncharacterized protein LOC129585825 [Paramacrobiotus metropolitanus]|uniref:uncharacterized protein LOC129585825 n=1 Tax=Paramacrobiotus metropolitanus TaxID=2943436 RepID=UPI0024460F79|nr:uncharacterized protein LOC129585825 [Paramacrobiotus metropolitanus]